MRFRSNQRDRTSLGGGWALALVLPSLLLSTFILAAETKTSQPVTHWEIAGDLTEACSCAVPCTCNFGQGPSPRHYCWAMFSLSIGQGHYGNVKLDGLHLAAAHGRRSAVWYIDDHATPEQTEALKAVAQALRWHAGSEIRFETVPIAQVVGEKGNKLQISGRGGFEADYITGLDGKTPVVVENNTSWNIRRSVKGKVKELKYSDRYGNKLHFKGVNSNEGKFDWTDQTQVYF